MGPPVTVTLAVEKLRGVSGAAAHSPYEAVEMSQGLDGPGLGPLQDHTQDVDTQKGADGHYTEDQPLLERHSPSRCV